MSTELEQKALNRLLEGLRNLGCSYVVIDKDGADYTYGDALKKGQPKKGSKYGHYGALREYYGPWLTDLAPGDTVEIPAKTLIWWIFSPVSAQKPSRSGALAHASLA
jgi:hypothetical protein